MHTSGFAARPAAEIANGRTPVVNFKTGYLLMAGWPIQIFSSS
jgi:hypothetical protein